MHTSNTLKTVVLLSGLAGFMVVIGTPRNDKTAIVCVTAGLLQVLDRSEVRGVLAHEVKHIRNKDILVGSIAAAVATAISVIANLAMFAGMLGRNNEDDGPSPADVDPAHATAYIVDPLTGRKQANFAKPFMTHPPIDERIARLLGAHPRVTA
jgi:Zn-dependent protease with chaperone function